MTGSFDAVAAISRPDSKRSGGAHGCAAQCSDRLDQQRRVLAPTHDPRIVVALDLDAAPAHELGQLALLMRRHRAVARGDDHRSRYVNGAEPRPAVEAAELATR